MRERAKTRQTDSRMAGSGLSQLHDTLHPAPNRPSHPESDLLRRVRYVKRLMWKWMLVVIPLLGCTPAHEGWIVAQGYRVLGPGQDIPSPSIGPIPCRLGYQAKLFPAVRPHYTWEPCDEVEVKLLVCCRSDDCYGSERERFCYHGVNGEEQPTTPWPR